jgi:dienelactone hydrolase
MILKILKSKRFIASVIAFVVLAVVCFNLGTSISVTEHFFNKVEFSKKVSAAKIPMTHESTQENTSWLNSVAEEVKITTDGNTINSVFLKNKDTSHSYIIILGALMSETEDFSDHAFHFYDLGFNVYIPTYLSQELTMGKTEQNVLKCVVDYVIKNDSQANIFIYGMGIGGTTAILYAGAQVPENVRGVIADSAYGDVKETFKDNIERFYGVSSFPAVAISSGYMDVKKNWSYSDVDVFGAAKRTQIPILYIHGTEDSIVSVNQSNNLFEVTTSKGTKHVTIYGAEHCQTLKTDSVKYWRETDSFIMNTFD